MLFPAEVCSRWHFDVERLTSEIYALKVGTVHNGEDGGYFPWYLFPGIFSLQHPAAGINEQLVFDQN